ncbi:hypothetical protein [Marinovum algicola]|uniref:hypothetical protein n=1 Tax=Marinovum algicola TaxID=42444 RepID=UPI003B51EEB6
MLDQFAFDSSEDIAEALDAQEGIERALRTAIGDALAGDPERETTVLALIGASAHYRGLAFRAAERIARSGKEIHNDTL